MHDVRANEPGTRIARCPSSVEQGDTGAIVRHGEAVPRPAPAEVRERTARKAAVESFEAQRAGWKCSGMSIEEILAARHEGHRW